MSVDIATLALRVDSLEVEAAGRKLDNFTAAGGRAEKSAGMLAMAAKSLAAALAAVKMVQLIQDSIMMAARYETLGVVMKVVGNNAGYTADQMYAHEKSLQKNGIAMIESRDVLIKMASAQMDLTKATELSRVAQDAAVIGGINSSEAFTRIVDGIKSGEVEVLKSVGLNYSFEESYRKLEEQLGRNKGGLSEMEKTQARFNGALVAGEANAGAYEASMDTAGKQMLSTTRYLSDLKVKLGAVFNDALILAVSGYTDALKVANTETERLAQEKKLKEWGEAITTTMAYLGNVVQGVAVTFQTLGYSVAGFSAIALAMGDNSLTLKESMAQISAISSGMNEDISGAWSQENFTTRLERMKKEREVRAAADQERLAAEEQKRIAAGKSARTEEQRAAREKEIADARKGLISEEIRDYNTKLAALIAMKLPQQELDELAGNLWESTKMGTDANKAYTDSQREAEKAEREREREERELERALRDIQQVITTRLSAEADLLDAQGLGIDALKKRQQAELAGLDADDKANESIIKQTQAIKLENAEAEKRNELERMRAENRLLAAENAANAPGQSEIGQIESKLQAELAGINDRYQREASLIEQDLERKRESTATQVAFINEIAEAQEKLNRLQVGAAYDTIAAEKKAADAKVGVYVKYADMAASALDKLAASQDTTSKEGFEAAKDLALGAAAVNTASAIMAQLTIPGPVGWAGAALAFATGMEQINNIQSASYGNAGNVTSPGGSASSASLPQSTVLGAENGTGSASIANSNQLMEDQYELTDVKLTAIYHVLKDLNDNITGLVTGIYRTGGLSTEGINLGTSMGQAESFARSISFIIDPLDKLLGGFIGNFAGGLIGKIFGGSTTSSLQEVGLKFGDNLVSSITSGIQASAQQYTKIRIDKDGGWFGSDSTSFSTVYKALDTDVNKMITMVFDNMSDTLLEVAEGLGQDTQKVMSYVFKGGTVNLKDMDSDEMQTALSEYFSGLADNAVDALFGDIVGQYQQLGEGMYETAIRILVDKEMIVAALDMTNQSFDGTVLEVIAFSEKLIEMAGDLDTFTEAATTYYDKFFSDDEKQTRLGEQLVAVMATMDKTLPTARDGYRAIVEGLDLTTDSGMEAYVTLLKLADTADTYYSQIEKATDAAKSFFDGIEDRFMSMLDKLNPQKSSTDYLSQMGAILAQVQSGDFSGVKSLDSISSNFANAGDGAFASRADYQRAVWGAYHLVEEIERLNEGRQSFAVGSPYVPYDMTADIHQGEIIMDSASSNVLRKYGIPANSSGNKELLVEIVKLREEVAALRAEQKGANMQIGIYTKKTADLAEKTDTLGPPPARTEP